MMAREFGKGAHESRAVRGRGPPDALVVEDIPSPKPGKGQLLVSVKASGVNFPDLLLIQNKYQFKPELPFSPGSEIAGVVRQVGEGVHGFMPADRVMARTRSGGYAQEVVVDEGLVAPVPAGARTCAKPSRIRAAPSTSPWIRSAESIPRLPYARWPGRDATSASPRARFRRSRLT
jgi:D-arabinose 1-dehydrogenase-like Zn-dependent alcohol dehydrogenase